jgi:small subunit ribosomal protein S21
LAEVKLGKDEPIDRALKKFKREVRKEGILMELKKREFYEKPSEKRKRREAKAKRRAVLQSAREREWE